MTQDSPKFFSPKQAAIHVGCGRTTIMRALSTNKLKAIRDNKNAWRISEEDLNAWSGQRPVPDQTPPSPAPSHIVDTPSDTPETLAKLAVAEARLADAIADRDKWRDLALRLSEPRPVVAVSFWERIFGRR
jgi:excisionase family DNA binding protein